MSDRQPTQLQRATMAVEDYGCAEYERGFIEGVKAAWQILRWADGSTRLNPASLRLWAKSRIDEAYQRAGIDLPEEGREP